MGSSHAGRNQLNRLHEDSSMTNSTLNHSVKVTHRFRPLDVEGVLPTALEGTAYRVGPGLLERFGAPVAHPFDADGAVTAVRFSRGRALGACRLIESPQYLEEERAGRFLYGFSASLPRRFASILGGKLKSSGNTNLLSWQGSLYGLMEAARPIELDPSALGTENTSDLGIGCTAFSAHPHRVESLATTFNFGLTGKRVELYALPDRGPARRLGQFKLPWLAMVHDFIATERHLVFIVGPAKLSAWKAILGIGALGQAFDWVPLEGTHIVVVPLANPDHVKEFRVAPFWVWHFVNAFEDGDDVVVDLLRHENFSAFQAPSSAGPAHGTPDLQRYRIDARRSRCIDERLWEGPVEFPSVHPAWTGARHRFTWLQTFPTQTQHPGTMRLDLESGTVTRWNAPMSHLGSEPMFVPADGTEARGWVLQLLQDPALQRSYVAVLDAEHIEDGPVARVWFDQPIPMTFHGVFVAENGGGR